VTVLWLNSNAAKVKLNKQNDSIRTAFEMATATISDIQTNLDSIDSGISAQLLASGETPQANGDTRTQVVTRIKDIKNRIAVDKKRIAVLEKQLANSNVNIKGLNDMVATLKKTLEEKEKVVQELSAQIGLYADSLSTERKYSRETIAMKESVIAEKQTIIEHLAKDINTIYYAAGTRKDLAKKGIIKRVGGFLGIGRMSVVQKPDLAKYENFDLVQFDSITFPATKGGYSILTNQATDSYLVEKSGETFILNIIDKELFRKHKFLVIEIR
jgi:uncharacterized coiled-coil protein SlyX